MPQHDHRDTPSFEDMPRLLLETTQQLQENTRVLNEMKAVLLSRQEPLADLIGIEDAAKILGFTVNTVRAKCSRKELPYMKAEGSKALRFSRKALDEYIRKGSSMTSLEAKGTALVEAGKAMMKGRRNVQK